MTPSEIDEQTNLKKTLKKYKEAIGDIKLTINSLTNRTDMDKDTQYALLKQYQNKLRVMIEGVKKPYFARIDFKGKDHINEDICYIGKVGVSDSDNKIITVDWRAPIASLYYDSNLGFTSYLAPEGRIEGELKLKRQYDIENETLISYHDVDTVSNDEILKPYLDVNADNRLKNIVSSIQEEQNQVIRKELSENIIVQGVAGSGKTTVALHRIAYLAYNHKDKIHSNQYMVIGPNKFFIQYISSVLPDLDVTEVPQLTYEELVKKYTQEEFQVKDVGYTPLPFNIYKYKVSMEMKEALDQFIKDVEKEQVLPKKDFEIKGFKILPQKSFEEIYQSIDDKLCPNLELKIEKTILIASNMIEQKEEELLTYLLKTIDKRMNDAPSFKEKTKIIKDYEAVKKEIIKGCTTSLKKYFTFKNKKVTTLYDEWIKNIDKYIDPQIASMIKRTKCKEKNTYALEDLPALAYLNLKIKNNQEFKNYRHTVIDEAQDYGEFAFYTLKEILSKSTFSIFGDLAQSIYDYRSIHSWEEVLNTSFQNDGRIQYLRKSYRTTIEIMEAANEILEYIGLKTAEPVIRHGENVKILKLKNNLYKTLEERIQKLKTKKYNSIALISRNDNDAHKVTEELTKQGLSISEITQENQEYTGGLCSVSCSLAKGLEFDAVIITDASEKTYHSKNQTDMKNLYVSMTRPLHELEILYQDELTKPLQKYLKKER